MHLLLILFLLGPFLYLLKIVLIGSGSLNDSNDSDHLWNIRDDAIDWKWILNSQATSIYFRMRKYNVSRDFYSFFLKKKGLDVFQNGSLSFSIDKEFRNFFLSALPRFTTRFLCFRYYLFTLTIGNNFQLRSFHYLFSKCFRNVRWDLWFAFNDFFFCRACLAKASMDWI